MKSGALFRIDVAEVEKDELEHYFGWGPNYDDDNGITANHFDVNSPVPPDHDDAFELDDFDFELLDQSEDCIRL